MFKEIETAISQSVMPLFMHGIAQEFNRQGHRLTGATVSSMTYKVEVLPDGVEGSIYASKIMLIQNLGIAPNRIPYNGRTGAGGTSKYIEGLIAYAIKRGMENPKAAAFAIAAKHKKEGMQTLASGRFSSTGARKGFVAAAILNNKKQANIIIFEAYKQSEIARLNRIIRGEKTA